MNDVSEYTAKQALLTSWAWVQSPEATPRFRFSPLKALKNWLDRVEINSRKQAHRLCQLIPAQCPFERDIHLLGFIHLHIPPMCKLNPLYEELVSLRFRALCYLADQCGEDISAYC